MPIKVAHVLSHVANVHAGVPIGTKRLVSSLIGRGIQSAIWSTGNREEQKKLTDSGVPGYLFDVVRPVGWRRSPALIAALEDACSDLDLFHLHEVWHYPQYAAARLARRRSKPYIVAPRASLEPWRMKYKGLKKGIYLKLLGNELLDNAACLHAVSPGEADGFRALGYKGPIFVVYNGIVTKEFEHLPEPSEADAIWPQLANRRVVLFLSRISPEKGLDQLVPAWAEILRKPNNMDALLVLAGPDDRGHLKTVQKLVNDHALNSNVLFTGMVDGRSKLALISRADIYVLPSYSEGFSNSLLENMAAGKPAIITPGCHFPEVADIGAGYCVEPSPYALASVLQELLDMSDGQRRRMGARGREFVMQNLTWDIAARKIITVYNAIMTGREIPLNPYPIPLNSAGAPILD